MTMLAVGLILALALYLTAIYGIHWSAERRIGSAGSGGQIQEGERVFSFKQILHRHSVEWLVTFFGLFFLFGIADFSMWQRLGLGAILALIFGSIWFEQSGSPDAYESRKSHSMTSSVWYWSLAVLDWLGFFWVICLSSALVAEIF